MITPGENVKATFYLWQLNVQTNFQTSWRQHEKICGQHRSFRHSNGKKAQIAVGSRLIEL